MSVLISWQWRNCQFSVIVRKMPLVKCFLDIVPLKKADAEGIYLALVKCIKDKIFRLAILQEWVLMVLPPFLVKRLVGVQAMTKETCSPCSICPLSPLGISLRARCQ